MTRDDLVEKLAQASWEYDGDGGPWAEVGDETRRDWRDAINAAIRDLERIVPEARTTLQRAVIR